MTSSFTNLKSCNLDILPICEPDGPPSPKENCNGWRCCKNDDEDDDDDNVLTCHRPAKAISELSEGMCDTNSQNCYVVSCTCEIYENYKEPRKGLKTSAIIGLVLSIVLLIPIMIGLMFYCRRKGVEQGRKESNVPGDAAER